MNALALPESAQLIADIIGRDRALYLIGRLPRSPKRPKDVWLYVPKKLSESHQLVKLIGMSDAQKLVKAFGGQNLCLASCHSLVRLYRDEYLRHLKLLMPEAANDVDIDSLAKVLGVSSKQARNLMEKQPEKFLAANDG